MRKVSFFCTLIMSATLSVCAQTGGTNTPPHSGNHLIVFYSWSDNSRTIANELHALTGGDIVELTPATPYTSNYNQMLDVAKQEIAAIDKGNYPAINNPVSNIVSYDTVFIIYPLWWAHMATPMQAFLHNQSANLRGKTLALICTSASSGISQAVADAKRLCPNSTFTEALHIRSAAVNGAKNQLIAWLEKTGLNRR